MPVTPATASDPESVLRDRVRRGAALEDAINPGWETRIDGGRLDMRSCLDCIVGQLHGHYGEFIDDLAPGGLNDESIDSWAGLHGFNNDRTLAMKWLDQYEMLRVAWLGEINRRLAEPAAEPVAEPKLELAYA